MQENIEEKLLNLKQNIIDDISLNKYYWYNKDRVLIEVTAILADSTINLTAYQKLELRAREKQLNRTNNQIKFNIFEDGL